MPDRRTILADALRPHLTTEAQLDRIVDVVEAALGPDPTPVIDAARNLHSLSFADPKSVIFVQAVGHLFAVIDAYDKARQ